MKKYTTISQIQTDIQNKETSVLELTKHYLQNINQNQHLNAFLEVFEDEALMQAQHIDEKIKNGTSGRLAGLVIGIKDNIAYKDHRFSASSRILEGFKSLYNATVVERLLAQDALIIGRLNCDEFAMGSSNENSAFGNVLNPSDNGCVAGGSSGGSAAAVAAGLCHASLGTDTGGSIRQPAAFCGVVGFKPSYGRVSRWGIIAYGSSFDQVGPLTHSVEDAALITEIIGGMDQNDATLAQKPNEHYSQNFNPNKKYKIATLKSVLDNQSAIDPEVLAHYQQKINDFKAQGHSVVEVDFDLLKYAVPTYYLLATAEASSNLSRYGGVLYGYRSPNAKDLETTYKKSRSEGFGIEVQRRIMMGTFVLSEGYYDAYYAKAQKVRRLLQDECKKIVSEYDFIFLPTAPTPAFKFGNNTTDPIKTYLEDIFTVLANLVGMPAISLPTGKTKNGLPMGMQLMANTFEEQKLLNFSRDILGE